MNSLTMLGLALVVVGSLICGAAALMIKMLKRERHRLDRAINVYNRQQMDDYDFYNGF